MLERLWAGWRLSYVESAADAETGGPAADPGSVFARILASGLPDEQTHIVWRGTCCFALLNAYPYTNGHVLVMPYREVGEIEALTDDEHHELWAGVRMAVGALGAAYQPEGINVGMNLGKPAGAGVPTHLHVHVLPRWTGDTNFMTTVAGTRVLPESLDASAARVRAAWPAR